MFKLCSTETVNPEQYHYILIKIPLFIHNIIRIIKFLPREPSGQQETSAPVAEYQRYTLNSKPAHHYLLVTLKPTFILDYSFEDAERKLLIN